MSLRVAMIIQRYFPHVGGAERQLNAVAQGLQVEGIEVHIVTQRYARHLPAYEEMHGVPVHRLPVPGPKRVGGLVFMLAAQVALRRIRPDVVHAHGLLSPTTAGVLFKRWSGTPIVSKSMRGGKLGDMERMRRNRLSSSRISSVFPRVDRFIVISREIREELAAAGVPETQMAFIPNGVDRAHYVPLALAEKQRQRARLGLGDGPVAIFTGRLSHEKRVAELIEAWGRVRGEFPDAQLLVLGTGPEADRLAAMGVPGVRLLGHVDNVRDYLQAADIFVLPSSTEGLSNAMLEAMATGLAVIVTEVGGAPDLIAHGEQGWLIAPDVPGELDAGLRTLLRDGELRARMGLAARERVLADYALDVTVARLCALYRDVTGKAR